MNDRLPYPPPFKGLPLDRPAYQSLGVLAASLDMSEAGVLRLVERGILPKPVDLNGNDRWRWKGVRSAWVRRTYIYVIACGDFIKIGITSDVAARFRSLERGTPYPISLIHWVIGTQKEEAQLHDRFAAVHHRGEWFRREGILAAWIEEGCHL